VNLGGKVDDGILKSNVETSAPEAPRSRTPRRFPLALALGGMVLLISGVAAGLVLSSSTQQRVAGTPVATRPASSTANTAGAPMASINGISCDALESTIVHIHVHLAIFVGGQEQQIPFGVGIGQPWQVSNGGEGPFVTNGSCFYWIHTHTDDGIVHIESPVQRRFTLADFFAIWQLPLSSTQVGPAQGQVTSYVNGELTSDSPPDIPLLQHAVIQLDVGTDVPPYQFTFPPGD
jgi:hypothetical protein